MLPSASPLGWVLAAVMGATALYHLRRVPSRWSVEHRDVDVDLVHAGMGVAMAVMFLGRLGPAAALTGAGLFLLATGWFAVRGLRAQRYWPQALASAAMLYMLVGAGQLPGGQALVLQGAGTSGAAPAMAGMPAMLGMPAGASRPALSPLLDGVFLVLMLGLVLWTYRELDRAHEARGERWPAGCRLTMNVGAVVMLLLML